MKKQIIYSIALTFIWIGFVGAISFMEAWLKFQAPNITTALGLGIGQLVFKALNSVEITCAILILLLIFSSKHTQRFKALPFLIIALVVLVIQTVWVLPALDARASLIINMVKVPPSKLHLWYVILELIKVTSLIIYGIKKLRIHTLDNKQITTT
ncbi:hypothetical protein [uncultured Lacinutrix sp.]|uniref:hypothetical protein n=1 Tax=uncultured Lacinutrix sp. TaxID=574032 RepID=UPI002603D6ED|nr:hypothetical protein [uncultured Lacinutrix sp.]